MDRLFITHLLAFLLGSIPFGYLIAKYNGVKVNSVGSRNIGATNVLRTTGRTAGIITLIADIAKGIIAVSLVNFIPANIEVLSPESYAASLGLLAMLGHCYSPFMKFKGGKGVATGLGMFLVTMPKITLLAIIIFAITLYISRYVSLASIISATSVPALYFMIENNHNGLVLFCSIAVAGFITARHIENIERLKAGRENKFDMSNYSKNISVASPN